MPPPRPTILCCGSAAELIVPLAVALAHDGARALAAVVAASCRATDAVTVVPAAPPGEDAVRKWMDALWARAKRIDAVVICPTISAPDGPGDPSAAVWQARLDAGLKSTFLIAKHAVRHLASAGGGRIVVVGSSAVSAGDGPAHVVAEGLQCMVEALDKAAPHHVRVALAAAAPEGAGRRPRARALARAVRLLAAPPDGP